MSALLASGVELMLVGMGTVFFFLTVLVGATTLMSKIVLRFAPEPAADEITPEEVAAITAAIALHRKTD
ncbi:MAG: OadG family transporter subunit [Pseudomonadota bacterium]